MNQVINVNNLSFSYSENIKALDGVSFQVQEGQIIGVLGPNGGGKTTLFKILSSLLRKYTGEIHILGRSQRDNLFEVLKDLGVVFQSPSLDKKLTVQENIFYHAGLYGLSKRQVQDKANYLLDYFSVANRKHDLAQHLSGGQARRVEIVKALIHEPKVLLLDEPSTGLDMGVRIELWNLLVQLRKEKHMTMLLTTHFAEEADRCDEIFLLNKGKIVTKGSPTELKSKLTFKRFQIKPKDLQKTQKKLSEVFGISAEVSLPFLEFETSVDRVQDLTRELAQETEQLIFQDPTLEDVFLSHTGHKIGGVEL